jgi:hypothetical protein
MTKERRGSSKLKGETLDRTCGEFSSTRLWTCCKTNYDMTELLKIGYPRLLIYSMEQSFVWEANQSLHLVKKFLAFLWNPKFPYCTQKCPPSVPILSQFHPVPTTPPTSWRSILILLPLSLRFHHQHPVHPSLLPHTRYMPRPGYLRLIKLACKKNFFFAVETKIGGWGGALTCSTCFHRLKPSNKKL